VTRKVGEYNQSLMVIVVVQWVVGDAD